MSGVYRKGGVPHDREINDTTGRLARIKTDPRHIDRPLATTTSEVYTSAVAL